MTAPSTPAPVSPSSVVVVVGGGLAALRTVAELRERGHTGTITVVADEPHRPYDRPPLSKALFDRDSPADLAADGLGELDDLADEVLRPARALRVDADDESATVLIAHVLSPDDSADAEVPDGTDGPMLGARLLSADVVVLATGALPVVPAGWSPVHTLRTWEDAVALRTALTPGAHLAVIGAGWIGAEVAGAAAAAGVRVTVFEAGPGPLAGQLPPELARHVDRYAELGIDLRRDTPVADVRPDGDGGAVVGTEDGDLHADVVLAALGARPATELVDHLVALDASGGVRVLPGGRPVVGPAALRVVGDAATVEGPDWALPGGHWDAALQHPAAVAADLLGQDLPPLPAASTFSTQLGREVLALGEVAPGAPWAADGRIVVREDEGVTALLLDADSRLRGAVLVDHPRDAGPLRSALRGPSRPVVDPAALADATVPLRRALRGR